MVMTRFRNQYSMFRDFAEKPEFLRSLIVILKPVFFLCVFLNAEHLFLSVALAKDCGTQGVVFPIEERDPIQLIQQKLKIMEESGEIEHHNRILQKKAIAAVERPKPVEGITKATESRIFYYDPSYMVKKDISDHQGHVFIKKGTKVNPLEKVSFSHTLLFFDGDDAEQVSWAQGLLSADKAEGNLPKKAVKLILVKGVPLALSEELKIPVHFDQGGVLTKKLGIRHVPASVTQEDLRLRIEEAPLSSQKQETEREAAQ